MNREKIFEDFSSLPVEAQEQVADFIAFLLTRYKQIPKKQSSAPHSLAEEEFIGMWRDRSEMKDSQEWVRKVRQRE